MRCGVQVGSVFALSEESGMKPEYRSAILQELRRGTDDAALVKTTIFSPTGFSFKVAQLKDTLSDEDIYEARRRICDSVSSNSAALANRTKTGRARSSNAALRHRSIRISSSAVWSATPRSAAVSAMVCWPRRPGAGEEDERRMDRRAGHRHPGQPAGRCAPSLAAGAVPIPCP